MVGNWKLKAWALEPSFCSRRSYTFFQNINFSYHHFKQKLQLTNLKRTELLLLATGRYNLLVNEYKFLDEFQAHHFILFATITESDDDLRY